MDRKRERAKLGEDTTIADSSLRVLIVERTPNESERLSSLLRKGGFDVRARYVDRAELLRDALLAQSWDMALCAANPKNLSAQDTLALIHASGRDIPVLVVYGEGERDPLGQVVAALSAGARDAVSNGSLEQLRLVVVRELSALRTRRALRRSERSCQAAQDYSRELVDSSRDAIAFVDDGIHLYANSTYVEVFGFEEPDDVEGLPILDLIAPEDQADFKRFLRDYGRRREKLVDEIDLRAVRSDGTQRPVWLTMSPFTFEGDECVQIVVREIAEQGEIEQELDFLRTRDGLTRLYNREYFHDILSDALNRACDEGFGGVLLYFEIDQFATLRETIGVRTAELFIGRVAELLRDSRPEEIVLARMGDNAFAGLAEGAQLARVREYCEKTRAQIGEHVFSNLDGSDQSVVVTCSFGVVPFPDNSRQADEVLAQAFSACRAAQTAGGNRVHALGRQRPERRRLDPATALTDSALSLMFQSVVSLHDDSAQIYEVFVRMADDDDGELPQDALFSAFAQAGMLAKLDQWLVEKAVKTLAERHRSGHQASFLLTLSENAVLDESMPLFISKQLKSAQLSGQHLTFQISEPVASRHVKQVKAFISCLAELNCRSALKDYGTSASSANFLRHLTVNYLKLSADWSRDLAGDPGRCASLQSTVRLANSMGIRTVATGVGNTSNLPFLWNAGVGYAQGECIQVPGDLQPLDEDDEAFGIA